MPVKGSTMRSFRPMVQGTNGAVVACHAAAAMAGLDILKMGGNAIDAGVAVGLALNVVHIDDCNFLGVAPTVMYLADRKEVTTIDGLGVWPKAASLEYFQRNHQGQLPSGVLRALTPGAADAWITALSRYGTMTFADVVAPAIDLAERGFPMYRYLSGRLHDAFEIYGQWPTAAEIFQPGGRAPEVGEMFYQKDLAKTLGQVAAAEDAHRSEGREQALKAARDFVYKGELAKKIVDYCQQEGGLLTMEDLAEYHVRCDPPVTINYRGYDVYATGPWGQGPVFPMALKILEGFDVRSMGRNSAPYIHTITQALNLAFADREQYIADPVFVDVPMDELLSESYLSKRRSLIDPDRAWPVMPPAGDPRNGMATLGGAPQSPEEAMLAQGVPTGADGGATSYFAVIDKEGNVFSATPSEGAKSGGPIIPGTGLPFSLRGYQSKLQEGHPAVIAPGKRPRLTPNPGLVMRDGEPVMALGGHGGDHIPQGMIQTFFNVVEFGLDPQEAVEEPRFYSYNFPNSSSVSTSAGTRYGYEPGVMRAEGRIPQEVIIRLQHRGHIVERYPDWWEGSALYGMITRNPETGVLQAGADPRSEEYAVAY